MNSILIILGVLGIAAVLVAFYVFVVAARVYVSDELPQTARRSWIERSNRDRRRGNAEKFPLTVDGLLVEADRRMTADRRQQLPA